MRPSPESLYKWALATGGEILHVVECVAEWSEDRRRLEAAELTIGTLQADRIKAQATIDHYRTMLAAAETLLTDVRESAVEFRDPRIGYVTVQMDRGTWAALAGEEKP
jgi:hypothetical protein